MKKITLIALCLLLCVSLVGTVFAEDVAAATLTCKADKAYVKAGDQVNVTVAMSGCVETKGLGVVIKFDTNVFELVSGEWLLEGAPLKSVNIKNKNAVIAYESPVDMNGSILSLVLKVKDGVADGDVAVSAALSDGTKTPDGNKIPSVSVPGTVTIGEPKVECTHDWADATCTEPKTCKLCGETEGEALGHTEVIDPAVAATCTEPGKTEGKHCSVCDAVIAAQETVPALGHDEVVDPAVEATCTEPGKTEGKHCARCEEVLAAQQTVPAKGHDAVVDPAVEATCTEPGKTEGKHCSVCDAVIVAQETVPAKGHKAVVDPAVEATCTEPGKTEGKHCSVCDAVIVAQETVPAKGHTEVVDPAVEATCTEPGKTEGKHCSVCDAVIVAQETVPAKGHTEVVDAAVEATCTTEGKTEGKHCSVCDAVIVAQEAIPAKGHVPGAEATETTAQVCTVCGEVLTPALGHTHKTSVVEGTEPTCDKAGQKTYYVCECGKWFEDSTANVEITDKASVVIPALGHTEVVDVAVEAACTEPGKTEGKHCSVCEAVLVAQEVIPAKGHTEVIDVAVAATCTTDGKTEGKHCSVCEEVLVAQEVIKAKGHVPGAEATETTDQVCTVCGEVLTPALGHTHKTSIVEGVAATCTEAGQKTYYVCECGKWFEDSTANVEITDKAGVVIPALGHDWLDVTCTEPKTCKVCGETEAEALGHDWTDATCTEPKTCKVCGETEGEALDHDWTDATCTDAKTCKACGKTEGKALGHADADGDKKCDVCEKDLVVSDPNNPQTGDESNVVLWSAMMLLSVVAAAALIVSKKNLFVR